MKKLIILSAFFMTGCVTTFSPPQKTFEPTCETPYEVIISGDDDLYCQSLAPTPDNNYIMAHNCTSQSGKKYTRVVVNPITVVLTSQLDRCIESHRPKPKRKKLRYDDLKHGPHL